MQSFDNDHVSSAVYNRCCKQQLLAATSNFLRSRSHDILKSAAALQHSLSLSFFLTISIQLTASQKSTSSSFFFFFFFFSHPRSFSSHHSSATSPRPKPPYTSIDSPSNNLDYSSPSSSFPASQRSSSTSRFYITAAFPSSFSASLVTSYDNIERYEEALQLKEKTLKARRRILSEEQPDILKSMTSLVVSYDNIERKKEALQLEEKTLKAQRRILSEEHSDILRSMSNLVCSYDNIE